MTALRLLHGSATPTRATRLGALLRVYLEQERYDDAQWARIDADTNAERSEAKVQLAAAGERLRLAEARLWRIDAELAGVRWLEAIE